jgi:cytochrome c biogenesis protein CcdA
MIAGFSTVCVMLGAAIAYMAKSYPRHREAIETVGGILLISGLGLLGFALERACGHP